MTTTGATISGSRVRKGKVKAEADISSARYELAQRAKNKRRLKKRICAIDETVSSSKKKSYALFKAPSLIAAEEQLEELCRELQFVQRIEELKFGTKMIRFAQPLFCLPRY